MRIVFMGTPESAVPSLQRCLQDGHEVVGVWTQPDKPSGRGNKISPTPVKEFALSRGLPVHQPPKIKTPEASELFRSQNADVAVVVAYGRILPATFLEAPARGCVNLHFSLLPRYRGAAPVNWAIVKGENETGVTTMFIEPELDSGPILLQRNTAIGASDTAPELLQRLSEIGAELLGETLARLPEISPQPQNQAEATFAPILKKEDGLINWSHNALAIERAVRGFQPWPNAHTTFHAHGLIVWRAEPVAVRNGYVHSASNVVRLGSPGSVVGARADDLIVSCGENTALRLVEVQPHARRRMSARDALNGLHLKVGDRFG
jgi:methionyl-tRNA formyltransferase